MQDNPENVKYALVRRQPSAWRRGMIPAVIVALLQIILSVSRGEILDWFFLFTTALTFFAYWCFFVFLVWLWRVIRRK